MSEKKKALVETATRLFAQYGYHAVGIDRIIAESQVAKMTMYKYFPSKSKLVVEVLNTQSAARAADIASAVAPHSDTLEKLHAVFLWHHTWINSDAFTGCMFINAAAEFHAEENEILTAAAAQKEGFIRTLAGILGGAVEAENAEKIARRCVALLDGATISAQINGRLDAALEAWEMAAGLVESEHLQIA
ncbi:TetR/AcrR family transcriptional regulator [Trinickia terrae]|uniref:TetR/AcrR family transcriptional regulator n=1 Tax=Trinickia terrae TaxID=2571161 RepID=A0A4U1I370_9BURK|nr:TetR/AcrR family transcriptional regulator [Trinickia terrae]TKC87658.1 TetR/AcrR family transcriptional regulator [Trinickia terrae]